MCEIRFPFLIAPAILNVLAYLKRNAEKNATYSYVLQRLKRNLPKLSRCQPTLSLRCQLKED